VRSFAWLTFLAVAFHTLVDASVCADGYTFHKIYDSTTLSPYGALNIIPSGDPMMSGNEAAFVIPFSTQRPGTPIVLFTGNGGPLTMAVKSGDGSPLGELQSVGLGAKSAGMISFGGFYEKSPFQFNEAVFTLHNGSISTIVKAGDPAPVATFTDLEGAAISNGRVAFQGAYSGNVGLFSGAGGPLTTIAKTGDPARPTDASASRPPRRSLSQRRRLGLWLDSLW
jgi:hypothetical protein